ncbi:MAG: DarT ssDNA thymidine ADP-ribosyltransferase family protein [Nitrospirota bacterium]
MNRADIAELHYITPIENVSSILEHGILSNRQAACVSHTSVAMEEVQDKRRNKQIPGARPLQDYANLYETCQECPARKSGDEWQPVA